MKLGCVILCAVCLCGCFFDPFNALIWNRENAIRNNGVIDTEPWFEWWFYKVVLPDTGDAFFFTYGVVNPWDTAMDNPSSSAFVSMGNFTERAFTEERYPPSDFTASYQATDVRIGDQHATDKMITGSLVDSDGGVVSWDIQIEPRWRFNAMTWTMFLSNLSNIFWYPVQADALFSGWIDYKGQLYTFEDAPGFQDRNWGRSFPEWWVWIVANHFDGHPNTALAVGGGQPVLLDAIHGFESVGVGLLHEGKEYTWRPHDFDLIRLNVHWGTWLVEAINTDGYKIEIEASAPCDSFMDLVFMTPQGVEFHDFEALTGEVTVRLYKLTTGWHPQWHLIETLWSDFAGIEYGHHDLELFDCFETESKLLYSNH